MNNNSRSLGHFRPLILNSTINPKETTLQKIFWQEQKGFFVKITSDNWNYCFYQLADKKAIIGLLAEQSPINPLELKESYTLTVIDDNNVELYHQEYPTKEKAIEEINKKYFLWNFVDLSLPQDSCQSCHWY